MKRCNVKKKQQKIHECTINLKTRFCIEFFSYESKVRMDLHFSDNFKLLMNIFLIVGGLIKKETVPDNISWSWMTINVKLWLPQINQILEITWWYLEGFYWVATCYRASHLNLYSIGINKTKANLHRVALIVHHILFKEALTSHEMDYLCIKHGSGLWKCQWLETKGGELYMQKTISENNLWLNRRESPFCNMSLSRGHNLNLFFDSHYCNNWLS